MDGADREKYLAASEIINWRDPSIRDLAVRLSGDSKAAKEIAKSCFEWVRDNIRHSYDYKMGPVTCKASDVLKYATGYCYAKSHLLAALLRANGIPSGFCYQRISRDDTGPAFCLHGLNAVYLEDAGWYRIDARGNKRGVDAQFCPPLEKLAFHPYLKGEFDLPQIFAEPLEVIVDALTRFKTYEELYNNLPDWEETMLDQ